MTKKELEQLIDLKKEIKELEQSILKIQQMYIGDAPVTVDASKKNFPYIQGKAIVHGYNPVLAKKRSEHLCEKKMLLDDRRKKAAKEEKRLIQYINSIPESRIRRIMQFRYIDGFTWEKIGEIMHCDRTTVEKSITRYLKKICNLE